MAERTKKLTDLACRRAGPGYLGDGGGLYLQTTASGAKTWVYRFQMAGRAREMGLGSFSTFTLAEARERARAQRQLVADGIDPIEHRKAQRARAQLEAARALTFDQCAAAYVESRRAGWKNAKHAEQWANTLATYVSPIFGAWSVQAITTDDVLRVLDPIWVSKQETARRIRGRIERILAWATVRGYRVGDNPARWTGLLKEALHANVQKVRHHPALPYAEAPAFMAALRQQEGVAARALEFLVLTAARTGEVIGARWDEFDLAAKSWTVPGERMKAGRDHEVLLPPRALAIVKELAKVKTGDYVFPGRRPRDPLSNMAMLALLKRMNRGDLTAHGFRSTFRDWCADCTDYPGELAEMALAHVVGDKVEAAYRRGTMKEKRRKLLADWATYCQSHR